MVSRENNVRGRTAYLRDGRVPYDVCFFEGCIPSFTISSYRVVAHQRHTPFSTNTESLARTPVEHARTDGREKKKRERETIKTHDNRNADRIGVSSELL